MMMSTFSVFDHKCLSWANLVKNSKIQNYLFKVKLDTKSNSNMQNSMAVYFICFRLKIATLFGKFGPKYRNYPFKLKIGT